MIKYVVTGAKGAEGEPFSFAVVVQDDPRWTESVFVFENFELIESGDGLEISTVFVKLDPSGVRVVTDDMDQETIDFMKELVQVVTEDFIKSAVENARDENTTTDA